MIANNRKVLNSRSPEEQRGFTDGVEKDVESFRKMIAESFKMLEKAISDSNKTLKELGDKLGQLEKRLEQLENSESNDQSSIHWENEGTRKTQRDLNMPLMPGTGFASVTPAYLRSLSKPK